MARSEAFAASLAEAARRSDRRARGLPLHETPAEREVREKEEDDRLEREIQAEIVRLYRAYGFIVWILSQKRASKQSPGIPDVYAVNPRTGHVIWHEVKTPTGRQSAAQSTFQEEHRGSAVHYVLGGVAAARAILNELGFHDT